MMLFLFLILSFSFTGACQTSNEYDEISLVLNVQRIGSSEINAVIKNEWAYLSVKDIFNFLKIRNSLSSNHNSVSGFFINPESKYEISQSSRRILYQGKKVPLGTNDIIVNENDLYLKSTYFGSVFGLDCTFDFRSLSVRLDTKLELPVIREMQRELMRKNIGVLIGEKKADTTIRRKFSFLRLGVADWSAITTQETNAKSNTRLALAMGALFAGGEANVYLNYNSDRPFQMKDQFYRWRYVNNNNPVLRQVTAGKMFVTSTSSIFSSLNAVEFTNTPTTYRSSFGTYRLSNTTEPGWLVELYVNNVLINFVKADASGFFTFDVPIVYGASAVRLKFYGPWGEERVREQNITIPFNFLPLHKLEYNVTAGLVDDETKGIFSRGNLNYGLSKHMTVGVGMEYLSTLPFEKKIPFFTTSLRLGNNIIISGEHNYGVNTKTTLSYRLPSNLQVDMNYIKYVKGQTAIRNNYLEERKVAFSFPFSGKKVAAFMRASLYQVVVPKYKFTNAEFLVSGVFSGISSNITTSAVYSNVPKPIVSSNFSLTFRLPKNIRINPQARYEYNQKNFSSIRCELEKSISGKGFLNFSYERNVYNKTNYFVLASRYNFSFAQIAASVRKSKWSTATVQSASGSVLYYGKTHQLAFSNQAAVNKGSICVLPFLDINGNGKRDTNEPKVWGVKVNINGGQIKHSKDTSIIISGLEPYTNCFIEFDNNSFESIAWRIQKSTFNIPVEPNYLKRIELPISVLGEAAGDIYLADGDNRKSQGRIIVDFYNEKNNLSGRAISDPDGYFSFLGLAPGKYTAKIDGGQLKNLQMKCLPAFIPFVISPNPEGDIMDTLEFTLYPLNEN